MTDHLERPELVDIIAKTIVREQSNGLCAENYPWPCFDCDCSWPGADKVFRREQQLAEKIITAIRETTVKDIDYF